MRGSEMSSAAKSGNMKLVNVFCRSDDYHDSLYVITIRYIAVSTSDLVASRVARSRRESRLGSVCRLRLRRPTRPAPTLYRRIHVYTTAHSGHSLCPFCLCAALPCAALACPFRCSNRRRTDEAVLSGTSSEPDPPCHRALHTRPIVVAIAYLTKLSL